MMADYYNHEPIVGVDELDGLAMPIQEHMERNTSVAQYIKHEANKAQASELSSLRD